MKQLRESIDASARSPLGLGQSRLIREKVSYAGGLHLLRDAFRCIWYAVVGDLLFGGKSFLCHLDISSQRIIGKSDDDVKEDLWRSPWLPPAVFFEYLQVHNTSNKL
jgi:hypothetical protein